MAYSRSLRIGLVALGLAIVPAWAQDDEEDGGTFLERQIERALSGDGFEVEVNGFRGALSSRATVDQITIADEEGVWLTVNDAVLDWNRSALLRRRLQVEELTAAEILLPRLPQGEERVEVPSAEARPFSLPELPVSIQIGRVNAELVDLGQPIIGEEVRATLEGSAELAGGAGDVDIRAERIDGERGVLGLVGSFDNESRELAIDVTLDEGPDGIVASLIDLPGRPSLSAEIDGSGPLSDFVADITLDTDGERRLTGQVELIGSDDGASRFIADLGGDVTALFSPTYRPFFGPDVSLAAEGSRNSDGSIDISQLNLNARALTLAGQVRIGADRVPDLIDVTGEIAQDDGPVLLPVGEEIRVSRVGLDVQFDASAGEDWTAEILLDGFDQPGVEAERIALTGGGRIAGAGETLAVTADLDLAATGLALDNGAVTEALGRDLTGQVVVDYAAGQPVTLERLILDAAGFRVTGQGSVDPAGENLPVTLAAQVDAQNLSVFSALAGRDLAGRAAVELDLTAAAIARSFDIALDGRTEDLSVGIPELDPLIDSASRLTIEASRDAEGTRLPVLRLTNDDVDIDATADLSSESGNVKASVRIADLSQVDPALEGPFDLTLNGTNPGEAWDLTLAAIGAGLDLDGDVTVGDLDADVATAEGTLSVSAEGLSRFESLVGRPLGGDVALELQGRTALNLQDFELTLTGTASDIAIGQSEVDALLAGRTELSARAGRTGDEIDVPSFRLANPQIVATGDADVAPGDSAVSARIALADLSRIVPEMEGSADLSLDATETASGWEIALDGTGAEARVDADATVTGLGTDGAPLARGTVSVDAADLSVFSRLAGRDLDGAIDLTAEGRARFDLSSGDLTLTGRTENVAIGQPELDALLQGVTQIDVAGAREGETFTVERLSLENPQITASGDGRYAPDEIAAEADIRIAELGVIVPEMNGPAQLNLVAEERGESWQVTLDGSGADARIDADATVTGLGGSDAPLVDGVVTLDAADLSVFSRLANRDLAGAVDLRAEGAARTDLSEADLAVTGRTENIAIGQAELDALLRGVTEIDVAGARDGEAITVERLSLENPQITVSGDGVYGPGQNAAQADIRIAELGVIVPEMSGPARVAFFAEEAGEAWQVSLDGDGAGAMIDALAEVTGIGGDAPIEIDGEARLTAEDLSRFSRIARRPLGGSVDAEATGSLTLDASRFDVSTTLTARNLSVGIAQVDQLLAGGTSAVVEARRDRAGGPIRILRAVLDASGIDAQASGSFLGGESDLTLEARLADLGVFVPELNGPVTVQGRAGQAGASFTLDLDGTGPAGLTAAIDGTVAEDFGSADLSVSGIAPLRIANPFIAPRALAGAANYDLRVNGPFAPTSVSGTVTVEGARIVDPTLPLFLDGVNATVEIAGQSAAIAATAAKQEGGTIDLDGSIGLGSGFPADLAVELNDVVVEDPRLYRTNLDGTVTVAGPLLGGATIGGRIIVDGAELRIPDTGLGVTGPIPDGLVHRNEPADVRATRARAGLIEDGGNGDGGGGGGGPVYDLNLQIVANNQIFLRGRGLDAELGGDLTLGGTTAGILTTGAFDLIRGRIDLLGQRLTLTRGEIRLEGDFDPEILIEARTDGDEVSIIIRIEGEALDPEISFLSEPSLPEDEVLARLLFGRSIDEISPLQAAQLASAVATLSGRGGDGIVSNLRRNIGLDDFDINTDADGNVGVSAGKYLSENVYTDVTIDAEGEAEINLNLDLTPSITVRGGTSNTGEGRLGIFFERDY